MTYAILWPDIRDDDLSRKGNTFYNIYFISSKLFWEMGHWFYRNLYTQVHGDKVIMIWFKFENHVNIDMLSLSLIQQKLDKGHSVLFGRI